MGLAQEVLGNGMDVGQGAMAKLSGAFIVAGTLFKAVVKVGPNEMGVRTRNSRAERIRDSRFGGGKEGDLYGIVGPGLHPVVPFTHSISTINVGDRSNDLSELQIDRGDTQYKVLSSIIWRVMEEDDHPYRALYKVESGASLAETVTNTCSAGLRCVMESVDEDSMKNQKEVQGAVIEESAADLYVYGVHLKSLNLLTVARTIADKIKPIVPSPYTPGLGATALGAEVSPDLKVVST